MARKHIAAFIFDINSPAGKATLVALAVLVVVLTMVPTAQAQSFTVLHAFTCGQDGSEPMAGVTRDSAGNLYGTTYYGGANREGVVFKLAHEGSGWVLTPLYSFQQGEGAGGYAPVAGVTIGSDGNLYGTTTRGGQYDVGTVYKLTPPATICRSFLARGLKLRCTNLPMALMAAIPRARLSLTAPAISTELLPAAAREITGLFSSSRIQDPAGPRACFTPSPIRLTGLRHSAV